MKTARGIKGGFAIHVILAVIGVSSIGLSVRELLVKTITAENIITSKIIVVGAG